MPIPAGTEVRSLWVVRNTLVHPDSIRAMVRRAADAGFNTLIVQVRGRGDAYYRGRWEPPPPGWRSGSYDPLERTIRGISGAMGTVGPRRLWMREVRELVDGVALTPFVRAALASDFASPFANAGEKGLGFINSDVTLYLHRLPVTNRIGFDVVNHHATDGIAIGECWLYDEEGAIGTSTVAALAQRKPMTNVPPP